MQKILHSLGQASEKLRNVSLRLQGQEEEVCLQQSQNHSPKVCNHQRKVRPEAGKRVPWDKDTLHHCKVLQGHITFGDWWGQRTLDRQRRTCRKSEKGPFKFGVWFPLF